MSNVKALHTYYQVTLQEEPYRIPIEPSLNAPGDSGPASCSSWPAVPWRSFQHCSGLLGAAATQSPMAPSPRFMTASGRYSTNTKIGTTTALFLVLILLLILIRVTIRVPITVLLLIRILTVIRILKLILPWLSFGFIMAWREFRECNLKLERLSGKFL